MTFRTIMKNIIKIIKAVGEDVLGVLSNAKVLLRCALLSITESIRNNPERYRSIFYNMSSIILQEDPRLYCSYMYGRQIQQHISTDYGTEANTSMIVDEAEKLFNKLVKDCIYKTLITLLTDHHYHC